MLDAIEAGIIYATMVQRPVQMGKLSISESFRMLTEGYVPECALLDTGVTVVTLDNITPTRSRFTAFPSRWVGAARRRPVDAGHSVTFLAS